LGIVFTYKLFNTGIQEVVELGLLNLLKSIKTATSR